MSYDFELYAIRQYDLPRAPQVSGTNISVDGPLAIEIEDIPEEYLPFVGKKRIKYEIHLEGDIRRNDPQLLDRWLRDLVTQSKGVLIDLQTNTYETPGKGGEISPTKAADVALGHMSFYFLDGEGFYARGFETMLNCIAKYMPVALPQRFGTYEPLQGKVEGANFKGLVAAFKDAPDMFMKSKAPFGHIYMSIPCAKTFESYHPRHFIKRNFLVGNVSFELRPKVFSDPFQLTNLRRLFAELCVQLDVIYAEIDPNETHGTAWRWLGLPDTRPHTLCIGPNYQSVWDEIDQSGTQIGTSHKVYSSDRFGRTPPHPPADLIAPDQKGRNEREEPVFAPTFPFEFTYNSDTYHW